MEYQVYIFDFDYTLGDATIGIITCVNYALEKMGFPLPDREEIRRTVGMSLPKGFAYLTKRQERGLGETYSTLFLEKAAQTMVENTVLFEGTLEVLQNLKAGRKRIGVVSNKQRNRLEEILQKFKIINLIDVVVGGDDVPNPKPDPAALLLAISRCGVTREQVLYIGDSLIDAQTARDAGVDFIAVTTGTTLAEDFGSFSPKAIIGSLAELVV